MIIYALGIHSGGGKVLLDHLLSSGDLGRISTLICDSRYKVPEEIISLLDIRPVKPQLLSRWIAEIKLKITSSKNPEEEILCFSSLPPAFKLAGKSILFFQNALLLPGTSSNYDSLKTKLRILYEKIWIELFIGNIDEIWVQTTWMKSCLERRRGMPIKIKPFLPKFPLPNSSITKQYDFITVSGNAPHKKLYELLIELEKLPDNGPNVLIITEEPNAKLLNIIIRLRDRKNFKFVTEASREEIFNYYQKSRILIVSSTIESFCLPIYEAIHFNLDIIAAQSLFVENVEEIKFKFPELTCERILLAFEILVSNKSKKNLC